MTESIGDISLFSSLFQLVFLFFFLFVHEKKKEKLCIKKKRSTMWSGLCWLCDEYGDGAGLMHLLLNYSEDE